MSVEQSEPGEVLMPNDVDIETLEEYYSYEDFCDLCADARKKQGLIPHIKIKLPVTTARKGLTISVCPECDGPTLDFGARKNVTV